MYVSLNVIPHLLEKGYSTFAMVDVIFETYEVYSERYDASI